MRMKMVCDDRTLREVANEFLALKKAQKVRERTLSDYKKYIDKFLAQSQNTLDVDVLKIEILEYFADIPKTSPARFNHPYQYLHALFEWCAKQDYLPYNPFQKLQLKKVRDEGNVQPAEIKDIQTLLKALDKHNYTELRDYNIVLLILDTGIRTSELMAIKNEDYDPEAMSIVIRPDVAKTSRSRTLYLSAMTNTSLKKFLKVKPKEWEKWLFPTRDGKQLQANVLGRNFRKYCERSGVKFTPYQIRHSFATFYLENGGDLFTLQRQMGHTDLQMTKWIVVYNHSIIIEQNLVAFTARGNTVSHNFLPFLSSGLHSRYEIKFFFIFGCGFALDGCGGLDHSEDVLLFGFLTKRDQFHCLNNQIK